MNHAMMPIPYGTRLIKLAIVNDTVVTMRLKTIYKRLKSESYHQVKIHIINLLDVLLKTPVIDIQRDMYNKVIDSLMHMKIDLAMKRYVSVHNSLRDLQISYLIRYKEFDD